MDNFKADLHLHTDFDSETGWHGIRPDMLATTVVMAGLDVAAVTQHNKIDAQNLRFRDELNRLCHGVHARITPLLGAEFTVRFRGYKCHLGYLFDKPMGAFHEGNLPPVYDPVFDERTWEQYRKEYPGVAILNHPFIPTNGAAVDPAKALALMESGAIDGTELINGSVLDHRARTSTILDTLRLFRQATERGIHLAPIAASDAHDPLIVGKVVTTFAGNTHGDVFGAIRNGQTKARVNRGKYSQALIKHMAEQVGGMEPYMEF
jgi:hypothetical protein